MLSLFAVYVKFMLRLCDGHVMFQEVAALGSSGIHAFLNYLPDSERHINMKSNSTCTPALTYLL